MVISRSATTSRTTSRMETTPTTMLPSVTGTWRMPCSDMRPMHSST